MVFIYYYWENILRCMVPFNVLPQSIRCRLENIEEARMKLTEEQIQQFDTEGYIFLPSCFSKEEIAVLNDAATEAV